MSGLRRNRHLASICFGGGVVFAMGFGVLYIAEQQVKEPDFMTPEEEEVESEGWFDQTLASWDELRADSSAPQLPEKVVIVFIQRASAVEELRKVINPERLVFSDEQAIAMSNGRIVATDRDAASNVLNELHWIDLPMEMWDRGSLGQRLGHVKVASGGGVGKMSEADAARYEVLANKAQLTMIESRELLEFMEKRGEI